MIDSFRACSPITVSLCESRISFRISPQDSFLGCIDQTYFKDPQTGKGYLLWKTDILLPFRWNLKFFQISSNIYFSSSTGFIQELDESGTSFKNGSSKLKIIETDQLGNIFRSEKLHCVFRPEENGTVEGLWLMFKEGTYYLFYSASAFQLPTYRMMVARSDSLLGPYVKADFSNIRNPHHVKTFSCNKIFSVLS